MTYTSEQLAEAIAAAGRYRYQPPPWMFSSLRPYRPPKPPKPIQQQSNRVIPAGITSPSAPLSGAVVAPVAPATKFDAEVVPVWQALLDVTVWRTRPWWWRLAASLVVRRLNR